MKVIKMKKKRTVLVVIISISMAALTALNLFVLVSCAAKVKNYIDENMLEILQTIRINRQNKAFDEGKIAENQANVIFNAIGNSDKETFKALFSQKALADCGNADEQIDGFMEQFGGKITSWEYYGMSAGGNVEYGEYKLSEVWAMVEFESNEIAYTMFFHMFPIDIENPDNIGLYNIFVITSSIYDEMLNHTRKTIMQPEMAEHPIIWIYEG